VQQRASSGGTWKTSPMKSSTEQSFKNKTNRRIGGRKMALINLILAFYTAKYLLEITDHVIYLKHFEKNV